MYYEEIAKNFFTPPIQCEKSLEIPENFSTALILVGARSFKQNIRFRNIRKRIQNRFIYLRHAASRVYT